MCFKILINSKSDLFTLKTSVQILEKLENIKVGIVNRGYFYSQKLLCHLVDKRFYNCIMLIYWCVLFMSLILSFHVGHSTKKKKKRTYEKTPGGDIIAITPKIMWQPQLQIE